MVALVSKAMTVVAFLCIVLFFLSYGQGKPWQGTRSTENGTTIIENPRSPLFSPAVLELQEECIINSSGKDYFLDKPCQLALGGNNHLYVSDIGECNIKVFNERGLYIGTIGRKGVGPGELDGLSDIAIHNNLLIVYSSGIRRLSYFDLQGKLIGTKAVLENLGKMQIDSNGDIYGVTTIADASGQPFYRVIKKNDKLESIGTIGPLVKQPPLSLYGVSCPFFLVTKDDRVIYGFPDKYEFVIFDKYGTLTTKIRKEYVPISIPREDRDQILKKENPFNSDIPKYFAPYSGIDADEEGRIFINTEARLSQLNTYDVFSPGGQFIATIRLRSYRHPLWTNKRVYTIEEDGDGYFLIRVSRVEWKY